MGKNISIVPEGNDLGKIQKAIEEIEEAGGGELMLKKGDHYSKPLKLVSNLDFILEEGARLKIIDNPVEYPLVWTRWEGTECFAIQPMIFAENCSQVNISGKGTIDGQGQNWWQWYRQIRSGENPANLDEVRYWLYSRNRNNKAGSGGGGIDTNFLRPPLVQFKNCNRITIRDICVQNSAFWNTHILYCSDVLIQRVRFKNPKDSPNTDGLDIDSSHSVTVSDCLFDVGDDCICIKSGSDADGRKVGIPSHSIEIRDCKMNKGHGGVVFGSESAGDIRNIRVVNCEMDGTDRGIRFKSRRGRGGTIEHIEIEDITMKDVLCPVSVNLFYRCGLTEAELKLLSDVKPREVNETTPTIRDIHIRNIKADNVKAAAGYFCGLPEQPITNVSLENVTVTMDDSTSQYEPAMDMFHTKVNNTGFLKKFTNNLQMKSVTVVDRLGRELQKIVEF